MDASQSGRKEGAKVRQRGIFPLPVPRISTVPDASAVSRSVRRKLFEAGHVNAWVRDVVIALNGMYAGRTDEGSFEACGSITMAQQLCLDRIKAAVLNLGKPPSDLSGREALRELQARAGYSSEPAQLASLQLDLLSLPPPGSSPSSIERILGSRAESFLKRLESKVLPDLEASARLSASELKAPYNDPVFDLNPEFIVNFVGNFLMLAWWNLG